MDHETEVAAPQAPPKPEVDERVAAFQRGAPLPSTDKAPARAVPTEPSRAPTSREVPIPDTGTIGEPTADGGRSERPDASDGSSGAARRSRRGGRGRGGRGTGASSGSTGTSSESGAEELAARAEPATVPPERRAQRPEPATARPERQARPERPAPTEATPGDADADVSSSPGSFTTPGAPRKRRRRGGRGRGRSSGGDGTTVRAADLADEGVEGSPAPQSAESQRDDAAPDARGATRSPSSGRSGSRSGSGSKGGDGSAKADAARARGAKTKQMSVEEQVAAGGPTRGIRGSRSRTGRDGRRRREPAIVPPRMTDKLMVITERGERDQIAVLEEDVLVQHYVTRQGATSMVGNVYLGRVQNVLPGMEAAFVDIGRGRNGVLYAGEVNYSPEDLEGPAPRIENVLKVGQAVMVQITKDPMGGKGARLTAQISLPGRYLVLAPDQALSGISRRLDDAERKRLKSILRKLQPPGHGVIVRTAAEGAAEEAIVHDLKRLIALWDGIQTQAKKVKAPAVLYEEPELTLRVFRDLFTDEEFKGLVTDSPSIHDRVLTYVRDIAPDLEPKVTLHTGSLPAFEQHRVEEQIHKALDRKVWLPSGGYLIIERTEAMTIVDVNTGKSVGKTNLEETVVNTNLEAAREVARQLRLRDIGGIIVVDFIDMLLDKNKGTVEETMKEAMALDKTRSQVFEIGPLGLMQVTRKRVSSGLVESFSETCPTCEGRGILINYES
ncbi:hypothetical protein BH18ACT17_BH18ACT17_09540 [soil metagenome]